VYDVNKVGYVFMTKQTILNYLKEHKEEFQKNYGVEKIGLFGSYARDEATKNSDIDLFAIMPPSFDKVADLKYTIEEDLETEVDLSIYHKRIKPIFLKLSHKDICHV
jgi:predicted nucleotidyltransferase